MKQQYNACSIRFLSLTSLSLSTLLSSLQLTWKKKKKKNKKPDGLLNAFLKKLSN